MDLALIWSTEAGGKSRPGYSAEKLLIFVLAAGKLSHTEVRLTEMTGDVIWFCFCFLGECALLVVRMTEIKLRDVFILDYKAKFLF